MAWKAIAFLSALLLSQAVVGVLAAAVEKRDVVNGIATGQLVLSPDWQVKAAPTVRHYDWVLTEETASPGGLRKKVLMVNGQSPGPLIEANMGDTVEVKVTNRLSEVSAIHWHGQPQNGSNHMDGALGITDCGISPGTSFTYRWPVQTSGTYWWHAHSGFQYTEGLRGPMVLHSLKDPYTFGPTSTSAKDRLVNTTYDGDQIIIAADLYNNKAETYLPVYMSADGYGGELGVEPVPDCGTVNGHGHCFGGSNLIRSNISVIGGQRYRFRLLNVGSLGSIRFSLQGHTMTVIEADGTLIEPQVVQSVDVDVAQRYSVLIEMDQPAGAYKFHAELLKDMFGMRKQNLVTDQYAVLRYAASSLEAMPPDAAIAPSRNKTLSVLNPDSLRPLRQIAAPPSTEQETLEVSFGLTADRVFRSYINGTSWDNEGIQRRASLYDMVLAHQSQKPFKPEELIITKKEYAVWDLIINNLDEGDHALHMHGYAPFVLGKGVGFYQHSKNPKWGETIDLSQNFTNPMRRDVFVVPAYGFVVVRIVLDNPGIWALHCHVAWHQAIGFMTQINVQPDKQLQHSLPRANMAQCRY